MLGDSIHHGTPWPQCGELDIFEQVDGVPTGYGTAHCGGLPGGVCNEPNGRPGTVGIPNNDFHTWSIKIDRTPGDWTQEVISWSLDGSVYHTLRGSDLGDQGIWATLAHSPLFIILNLAVGGDWYVFSRFPFPVAVVVRRLTISTGLVHPTVQPWTATVA